MSPLRELSAQSRHRLLEQVDPVCEEGKCRYPKRGKRASQRSRRGRGINLVVC